MSKSAFTMSLTGETTVGRSEFPGALSAELERQFGGREVLVINGADLGGVKPGLMERLYGHPDGYRTYGDEDGKPSKGLLAMLELGRMNGRPPFVFVDDGGDVEAQPLAN